MKKHTALPKFPDLMTDVELKRAFSGVPGAQVIRSLLMAEVGAIHDGAQREERTMRGMWYAPIKPALSRSERLSDRTRGGKPLDWARSLSKVLAETVRAGDTTYEELMIVDGSRQRQIATSVTLPVANVRVTGGHFPWVILFTEKDTIWKHVERVATLYGVSAISGGGEPSNACTENTVRSIVRSEAYRNAGRPEIVLLTLTDFDPAGYTIAKAQHTQIRESLAVATGGSRSRVRNIRLGLFPEQLSAQARAANAYTPKPKGLRTWLNATGGIDGEPLGLELDSLSLSQIRTLLAEGIEAAVDIGKRQEDLREAFLDLIACDLLTPDFVARRQMMIEEVKSNGLWKSIRETDIPIRLFREAAEAGKNHINPLAAGVFDCEEDVRAVMAAMLD